MAEKMSSRFHNNAILTQLDLVYEFCQWALARFVASEETHQTLYRGTNSFDEHLVLERINRHEAVMRLDNLASFSADREVGGCFGDIILTVRVPLAKLVFFNTLLARHALNGEAEYLVIGGDCHVTTSYV